MYKITDLFLTVQCLTLTLSADGEYVYYRGRNNDFKRFGKHVADGCAVHAVTWYEQEVEQYAYRTDRTSYDWGKALQLKPVKPLYGKHGGHYDKKREWGEKTQQRYGLGKLRAEQQPDCRRCGNVCDEADTNAGQGGVEQTAFI